MEGHRWLPLDGSQASGAIFELREHVSCHQRLARMQVNGDPLGVMDQLYPLGQGIFVLKSNLVFIVATDLRLLSSRWLLADARLLSLRDGEGESNETSRASAHGPQS